LLLSCIITVPKGLSLYWTPIKRNPRTAQPKYVTTAHETHARRTRKSSTAHTKVKLCAEQTQNINEICRNINGIFKNISGICKNIIDILTLFRASAKFVPRFDHVYAAVLRTLIGRSPQMAGGQDKG